MTKIVMVLCLIFGLFACSGNKENEELFSRAGQLLEVRPDSALQLLKGVDLSVMGQADRARCALLYVQAEHKAGSDVINDSLVQIALDYYSKRGDSPELAKAWHYMGCYCASIDMKKEAVEAFLNAERVALKFDEYNLLGLIYSNLGGLYTMQWDTSRALEMYSSAIASFRKSGNQRNENSSLLDKGWAFMYVHKYDSVHYYIDKGQVLANERRDTSLFSIILNMKGNVYLERGDLQESKECVKESIELIRPNIKNSNYAILSNIYKAEGKLDSARYCHLRATADRHNSHTRAARNYGLFELAEKEGQMEEALGYLKQYGIIKDSIDKENKEYSVSFFTRRYNYELEKNKIAKLQILIGWLVAIFLFVSISVGVWVWRKHTSMRIRQLEVENQRGQLEILKYKFAVQEVQDQKLKERIQQQMDLIRKVIANPGTSSTEYYKDMLMKILAINDWGELRERINLLHYDFANYMEQLFPQLEDQRQKLCWLACAGFSTKEIAVLLGKSGKTIDNWRHTIPLELFPDKRIRFNVFIKQMQDQASLAYLNQLIG